MVSLKCNASESCNLERGKNKYLETDSCVIQAEYKGDKTIFLESYILIYGYK